MSKYVNGKWSYKHWTTWSIRISSHDRYLGPILFDMEVQQRFSVVKFLVYDGIRIIPPDETLKQGAQIF